MTEFVATRDLVDGVIISGDDLPDDLIRLGIVSVSRSGRFVFFRLKPTSFLTDDARCDFVYDLDRKGRAVEELLSGTKQITYHIQHLSTPGWYYWKRT